MSLASMIAKQVVKATGDMFKDTDIQKAISAQVDEVVTTKGLESKDGQDYLLRMTKAMVTDDPNFKADVDLDPNLGMYLEVENKLFSGNPDMRDAYHAAKINNAKLGGSSGGGSSGGGKSTYIPAYKSEIGRAMGKKELVSDLEKIGIEYDYDLSTFDIQDFESMSASGKRLIKALEKEDFFGYDNLDQLLSDIFESGIENYEPSSSLRQAFGRYLNEISMSDLAEPAKINNAGLQGKTRDFSDATLRPYEAVTAPATYDEMFDSLHAGKREKINEPIADGSEVAIRLDIPAYLEKNTWVPTIHFGNKTSHRATVALKNADFAPSKGNEEQAFRIKIGSEVKKKIDKLAKEGRLRTGFRSGDLEKGDLIDADTKEGKKQIDKIKAAYNKTNFSRIKGNLINRTDEENYRLAQEALNDPEWTQIGYNPDRHSYYFDRVTGDPIIGGDEAIQVGHLVLVKNAVRSDRRDFKYAEGGAVTRTIKRGDTLSKISKETGVSISDLVKLNNIENPDFIRAGDTLVLGAEAQRQPDRREVKEPKRTGIRAAAARSTKAAPTESRSLMTRSRQRPTRERTEAPASLLTSTPIKTFVAGLFSSPVLKEDFLRVDEHNTLKSLAKGAIDRGRTGLSYKDYNRDAGSKLGYSMETPTDIVTDPFQALKFTLGKAEIVRDGDRVVVADEFDFNSPENISEKSLVDKIKFLADRTGQYFADDISAYGLAHSVGEVFNPPASGPSFRIGLGNAKDLGITREQFDNLPTLAEYSDRYEGRIKQRMAKGGKIDKKKMACNKPKRTASHPKKSHVVKACKDGKEKIIRFGEQGAKTAGKPKAGESKRMKAKRKSFKARHRKNIKRGNMSAAYWADKVKW